MISCTVVQGSWLVQLLDDAAHTEMLASMGTVNAVLQPSIGRNRCHSVNTEAAQLHDGFMASQASWRGGDVVGVRVPGADRARDPDLYRVHLEHGVWVAKVDVAQKHVCAVVSCHADNSEPPERKWVIQLARDCAARLVQILGGMRQALMYRSVRVLHGCIPYNTSLPEETAALVGLFAACAARLHDLQWPLSSAADVERHRSAHAAAGAGVRAGGQLLKACSTHGLLTAGSDVSAAAWHALAATARVSVRIRGATWSSNVWLQAGAPGQLQEGAHVESVLLQSAGLDAVTADVQVVAAAGQAPAGVAPSTGQVSALARRDAVPLFGTSSDSLLCDAVCFRVVVRARFCTLQDVGVHSGVRPPNLLRGPLAFWCVTLLAVQAHVEARATRAALAATDSGARSSINVHLLGPRHVQGEQTALGTVCSLAIWCWLRLHYCISSFVIRRTCIGGIDNLCVSIVSPYP